MKVLRGIKRWLKEERSAAEISGATMLMLFAIIGAIGIGWLVVKHLRDSGGNILSNLTETANQGVDPSKPPKIVETWE